MEKEKIQTSVGVVVSTAFAIAVALFWKDANHQAINKYVPPAQNFNLYL